MAGITHTPITRISDDTQALGADRSPERKRRTEEPLPARRDWGSDGRRGFAHAHVDARPRGLKPAARWQCSAFTLIEMLVVMTIVLIVLTLVLPATQALWDERKISDAHNIIRGTLMTSRAAALGADGVDSGLLFYVDADGAQRIVSIRQDDAGRLACNPQPTCQAAWDNVFVVTNDRDFRLPKPMRAVPRYVVESATDETNSFDIFSEEELANINFSDPLPEGANQAQRHRNYFSMVFSNDGRLLVRRDVLIRDDDIDNDKEQVGDITGLSVGYDRTADVPNVITYYGQNDTPVPIDPTNSLPPQAIPYLINDGSAPQTAINFPSVDGLLVYDDALFNNIDSPADKRDFLLSNAMPFYVSRMTGAVITGPVGEVADGG